MLSSGGNLPLQLLMCNLCSALCECLVLLKRFQLKYLNLRVFPNTELLPEGPSHVALGRSCLEVTVTLSVSILQAPRCSSLSRNRVDTTESSGQTPQAASF